MNARSPMRAVLVVIAISSAACGQDAGAPATPSATLPSPFVAQVEGQWAGQATLRQPVGGTFTDLGECIQADLNARLANTQISDRMDLSMTQTGSDVTGRMTGASTGLACTYTGRATLTNVTLNAASCDAPVLVVRCSLDRVREMRLIGSTVSATVDARGGTITGTVANTYNVFLSGADAGVAGVVLSYDYAAVKQ